MGACGRAADNVHEVRRKEARLAHRRRKPGRGAQLCEGVPQDVVPRGAAAARTGARVVVKLLGLRATDRAEAAPGEGRHSLALEERDAEQRRRRMRKRALPCCMPGVFPDRQLARTRR